MSKRCVVSLGCITYSFYGPELGLAAIVSKWSSTYHPTHNLIDYFGNDSFPAIDGTGSDDQTNNKQENIHTNNTKKNSQNTQAKAKPSPVVICP